MSLEEFEDDLDPKTKRFIVRKSIMDIGMGILYLGVGIFILFAKKFNFQNDFVEGAAGKIFAALVIAYGAWRVYRGIKKDYLIDKLSQG